MSDAWRATLYLSAYFFAFGMQLPYLPVWLADVRGLDGAAIAAAVFGAALGRIVTGPIITLWAEARPWRIAAAGLSFASAAGYAALLFAPHPVAIALAGFATLSIVHAIMPLGEAALLQATRSGLGPSFGFGRALGSVVFVGGVLLGGVAIDRLGSHSLVPLLLGFSLATAALALLAPKTPLATGVKRGPWTRFKAGMKVFTQPSLRLMLFAIAPVQASHAFYYAFSAVIWREQGASGGLTSLLWGMGVVTEILLLAFAVKLPAWATPERLILAGAAGGLIRWSWMGLQPDFVTASALQLLHGLSFAATFLGTVRLVERDAPPEERAAAFAFQAALATGAFTGVIGLVAGPLYDAAGVRGYWAMAGLCAFATFIAILMTRRSASNFPILAR